MSLSRCLSTTALFGARHHLLRRRRFCLSPLHSASPSLPSSETVFPVPSRKQGGRMSHRVDCVPSAASFSTALSLPLSPISAFLPSSRESRTIPVREELSHKQIATVFLACRVSGLSMRSLQADYPWQDDSYLLLLFSPIPGMTSISASSPGGGLPHGLLSSSDTHVRVSAQSMSLGKPTVRQVASSPVPQGSLTTAACPLIPGSSPGSC